MSKNMEGIAFSAEKAKEASLAVHRIDDVEAIVGPTPSVYSAEASLDVLRAGAGMQPDKGYLGRRGAKGALDDAPRRAGAGRMKGC